MRREPLANKDARRRQMMEGVEDSHLCIPFQCKMCWYWNPEGRNPTPGKDDVYLICICRANVDAMLGKSPLTIRAHRSQTLSSLQNAMRIDKTPSYHPRGPFLRRDPVGMSLAVDMLLKSLVAKGRILDHIQFAMLQKMTSTYTKNWESSPTGVKEGAAFANGKYRVRRTTCPAQSEWFYGFLRRLEFRMGCQSDPNHGLLMGAIVHLLDLIRIDADEAEEARAVLVANELWKGEAYVCILMAASLRGHEGFFMELAGLWKHLSKERVGVVPTVLNKSTLLTEEVRRNLPHVTLCLLGKFKGDIGIDHHLIKLANETVSGLQPRWWIEKLVLVCEQEGRVNGPAFATPDGELALSVDYDSMFRRYLLRVQ
jgi:hypothetical protein